MTLGDNGNDESEKALARLASFVCDQLLRDRSVADLGFHLEFHCGAENFREKILAALRSSVAELPSGQFTAILMNKVRQERRQNDEIVLTDDDLPPGFASN